MRPGGGTGASGILSVWGGREPGGPLAWTENYGCDFEVESARFEFGQRATQVVEKAESCFGTTTLLIEKRARRLITLMAPPAAALTGLDPNIIHRL